MIFVSKNLLIFKLIKSHSLIKMSIRRNRCPVKTAQGSRCKKSVKTGKAGCVFHCNLVDDVIYEETKNYEDGTIREKYMVKNHLRNGKCEKWYSYGEKWIESNYKEGVLHGEYKEWYPNGELFVVCNYKDEQVDGLYQTWDVDGTLYEAIFENGKVVNGKLLDWWCVGKKCCEYTFVEGEMKGIQKYWDVDGTQYGEYIK